MNEIINSACRLLEDNQPFVIATIVSRKGSTPRTAGAKMIVTLEGNIFGTIGGGLLEARSVEAAVTILKGGPVRFIPFDLSREKATTMDMICGGKAEVLLDLITPSHDNIELFQRWRNAVGQGECCHFVTAAHGSSRRIDHISHCLICENETVFGQWPLKEQRIGPLLSEITSTSVITLDHMTLIIEPTPRLSRVYIFGAGHVAQPTARFATMVGFYVAVMDDRAEFANKTRFPEAHETHVIKDFNRALSELSIDQDSYIVILTRGHCHDGTVLKQALKTNAGYIGMIGSRRKRDLIYDELLDQGFSPDDFSRVNAPIGLNIDAETPEEIAMSIVAELIQKRALLAKSAE